MKVLVLSLLSVLIFNSSQVMAQSNGAEVKFAVTYQDLKYAPVEDIRSLDVGISAATEMVDIRYTLNLVIKTDRKTFNVNSYKTIDAVQINQLKNLVLDSYNTPNSKLMIELQNCEFRDSAADCELAGFKGL